MRKTASVEIVFSPTDLIRYMGSPFTSWMDRYYLEHPEQLEPDEPSEDQRLIMRSGLEHEAAVLEEFRRNGSDIAEVANNDFDKAHAETLAAFESGRAIVYQAALQAGRFQGHADFVELGEDGAYIAWDTKLARSPKPYYIVQLCAYSEMIAEVTGRRPDRFGVILGTRDRAEFLVEDFIHYYRRVQSNMLALQDAFTGSFEDRPEPRPRADHGRWDSHAQRFFAERDHLVRVANISVGQIKKLERAGIETLSALAQASGRNVPKLNQDTLEKLAAQARLQRDTLERRKREPESQPAFEVLPPTLADGRPNGLSLLPPPDPADVFFDMEGYPLDPGGLEYLFGLVTRDGASVSDDDLTFMDWWAHDRAEERLAFEGFVRYVHGRWRENPGMHIYHYAPYEVTAVRRLSTLHDTMQEEVDDLLRNGVFVDLYQTVRRGLMVGEDSYSIKALESLYWRKRGTDVATAVDSIVQYANWLASGEPRDPAQSAVLGGIRAYNEDDCRSTAALYEWLRGLAKEHGLLAETSRQESASATESEAPREPNPLVVARAQLAQDLRARGDHVSTTLGDVLDYHRREDKPKWWALFDRAEAPEEDLRDDPTCIAGVVRDGPPEPVKRSLQQWYRFDPAQECKLSEDASVFFTHDLGCELTLTELDGANGRLALKATQRKLDDCFGGQFPHHGSLLLKEVMGQQVIQDALLEICQSHADRQPLAPAIDALLNRRAPASPSPRSGEDEVAAAIRVAGTMDGGCFVIQGPPGAGKTYTAARTIAQLLAAGKRVGITSNSHKAILNLMAECGRAMRERGETLRGIKVGGDLADAFFSENPGVKYVGSSGDALSKFGGGVVGGTAWLFSRGEWLDQLDFLFVDEAGQVPLANAVAISRSARNLVLLGDQMQLEQPVQGTHPGDARLSVLQYALKHERASRPDAPAFYPVIPADKGLFLGTSRRMHPSICSFISESIYGGRLSSHADCANQRIDTSGSRFVGLEGGIAFVPVEHDGNVQRSDEEVTEVTAVLADLLGRPYTDKNGDTRRLDLGDFLFVSPYNAQVRALKDALPKGAKVGSVDKFQGQEAPVTVLSLCSSYGEYGSRGLGFILDRNRVNVAISRAMCLAVVIGDPRIADTLPSSIAEMGLLNLYCKVLATGDEAGGGEAGSEQIRRANPQAEGHRLG